MAEKRNYTLIDGCQRSGTNLLLHLLDGHPDLATLPEELSLLKGVHREESRSENRTVPRSAIREGSFPRLRHTLDQRVTFFGKSLPDHAQGKISPPKGTYGRTYEIDFDVEVFWESLEASFHSGLSLWEFFESVIQAFWEAWRSRPHVNEAYQYLIKNHGACLNIDSIVREASNLKFLIMVRNPFDVVTSQKQRYQTVDLWNKKRFGKLLDVYVLVANLVMEGRYPNVRWIKYEDLVRSPEDCLREVCDFISVDFDRVDLNPTIGGRPWIANSSFENGAPGGRGETRNEILTRAEFGRILDQTRDECEYFGYPQRSFSLFNRIKHLAKFPGLRPAPASVERRTPS